MRYGSIGGLEYEVPQSRLYCLCINVALCSTALMYLSCDTKKFHDNESTHILHNFYTTTKGGSFPLLPLAAPLHTSAERTPLSPRLGHGKTYVEPVAMTDCSLRSTRSTILRCMSSSRADVVAAYPVRQRQYLTKISALPEAVNLNWVTGPHWRI